MPEPTRPDDTFGTAPPVPTGDFQPPAGAEAGPDRAGRFELLGEIARGGMGAVYRARDPRLNRDLAVKVLLDQHRDNPALRRRFLEEAQIAGQLQHPGVVPVHELGELADGRPFFAMKLVKGRTLAELLAERPSPTHDLPRFVQVFEQVCQTVAYAHSKGVIHRDLKPADVMVGAFGEVQVMDWGFAKVLTNDPANGEREPAGETAAASVIETFRGHDPDSATQAGSALRTYAYMPPEQAKGEAGRVDRRCDVFGLGAILCEILTGVPPYTGESADVVRLRALTADLTAARARLDDCGADPELIALAAACLAPAPDDRPADAAAVARAASEYRAGVEARLRQAEVTQARADLEWRLRALALAAGVGLLTVAAAAAFGVQQVRARAARADAERRVASAEDRARYLEGQGRTAEALAAAGEAAALADDDRVGDDVRARARELAAGLADSLARAGRDRLLLDRLLEVRQPDERQRRVPVGMDPDDDAPGAQARGIDRQYLAAFREYGLGVEALPDAETAWRCYANWCAAGRATPGCCSGSARPSGRPGTTPGPRPPSAAPSRSSPTRPKPTAGSAGPCTNWADWARSNPTTAGPSNWTRTAPISRTNSERF